MISTTFPSAVTTGGYSYHIDNDSHLMTVELPVSLDLTTDQALRLALNADRLRTRFWWRGRESSASA